MNRTKVLIALLILVAAGSGGYYYVQWSEKDKAARAAEQLAKQRQQELQDQEKLVAQAREWLDASGGNGELLAKAAGNLQRVLQANYGNLKAHIEMARLYLKAGYINYRNFQPGTLQKAEQELSFVLSHNGDYADALVLQGHLRCLQNNPEEALKVLERAEKHGGSSNPWLYLNWADALIDLRRMEEAEVRLKMAQQQLMAMKDAPKNAVRAMFEKMTSVLIAQRKLEDADLIYQKLIAFDPGYAWVRGNYAAFLLFKLDKPDAAIAVADQTLQIMDYGMARQILAAALYAKWAELKRQSPSEATQYLETAKAISTNFSWIMPQAAKSVSAGPGIQKMVKELMAAGVPLDTKDEHDDTGLTLAAELGDTQSVTILIKLGANIESKDNYGRTALAIASNRGHVETAKVLTAHGAKINTLDQAKITPLHIAVLGKHEAMVRFLISSKADINNSVGEYSPLMNAAGTGNEAIVSLLLQAGADPSTKSLTLQKTAADIAQERGFQSVVTLLNEAAGQRVAKGR